MVNESIVVGADPAAFSVEIRPQSGLDLGALTFNGVRHDWVIPDDRETAGEPWLDEFPGGVLRTSGLHNVGEPSEGHGLHGRFPLIAAARVETVVDASGRTVVTGYIEDAGLACWRRVVVDPTAASIAVSDEITNTTSAALQAPLLYHVNWGEPFLGPALTVDVNSTDTVARDAASALRGADWHRPWSAQGLGPVVIEHLLDTDPRVVLTNTDTATQVIVETTGLPRLHQWINLDPGWRVLGTEPANCSVRGREFDRSVGAAPFLAAGETRATSLTITLRHLS
jgi:hypothetical protein